MQRSIFSFFGGDPEFRKFKDMLPPHLKKEARALYRNYQEQSKRDEIVEVAENDSVPEPSDPYSAALDKQWREEADRKRRKEEERRRIVEEEVQRQIQVEAAEIAKKRIADRRAPASQVRPAIDWVKSNPSRTVLGAGCLVMVLALLFPPFQQSIPFYRGDVAYQHAGFHFLFSVPLDRLTVNIGLLIAELIVIGFATVALYVILKAK